MNRSKITKFFKALSIFAGTIIGVGIFGLPYAASKAGFFVVLSFFAVISVVLIINHLLYGEISLGTSGRHRLPGCAEIYLGKKWKNLAVFSLVFGIVGALLAYLIVGGDFLTSSFSPIFGGNNLVYTLLFFAAGAYLIFRGIKSICQIELALLVVFFVILIIFFAEAFPLINVSYLQTFDIKYLTFPYGVVLFSLWGLTTVPEVKDLVEGDRKLMRTVIISGILLAAVTYLFFIITVLGTTGAITSKEAISGLALVLGDNAIKLGFFFGTITCFTSFIALGLVLRRMFTYDMGIPKNAAWAIACLTPLILFLAGFKEFINIISLSGAIGAGIASLVVVFIYKEFLKKEKGRRMNPLLYLLPIFLVIGVFLEIFYCLFAK